MSTPPARGTPTQSFTARAGVAAKSNTATHGVFSDSGLVIVLVLFRNDPDPYSIERIGAVVGFAVGGFYAWLYGTVTAELIELAVALQENTRATAAALRTLCARGLP